MSPLLLALLGALLVPLFVGSWRMSLLGLALQGLILAALAYPELQPLRSAHAWLTLIDLGLLRGLLVPLALHTTLRIQGAPARNDTISASLFSWTLALGMVLAAFNFAELLVSEAGEAQTQVAIAIAGVLLGFLVLANAGGPFSQVVGALRIENAIALLALSLGERLPLGLQLSLLAAFVATVGLFVWYLATLERSEPGIARERESGPDSLSL